MTALVSVGVVAAGCAYVATPTKSVLAMSFRSMATAKVSPHTEVIYAKAVTAAGQPISHVQITLGRVHHGHFSQITSVDTGAKGTARTVVALPPGPYVIKVSLRKGHVTITATAPVRLSPGHAYDLTIHQRHSGVLIVIPVRSY
jgi:hypothetical protein